MEMQLDLHVIFQNSLTSIQTHRKNSKRCSKEQVALPKGSNQSKNQSLVWEASFANR